MVNYKLSSQTEQLMNKTITLCIISLFLGSTLSGCLEGGLFSDDNKEGSISSPIWTKGDFWQYNVKTKNMETSTTMVVTIDTDETDYYVAAGSLEDAKRHAVLNHNPALGRVQMSDFSVYENNIAQKVIDFPLKSGKSWSFNLYNEEFVATVLSTVGEGMNQPIDISASSDSGATITYQYNANTRWFTYFQYTDSSGQDILTMDLANHGRGFTGNAYFCRGGDLYDREFNGPDVELYDTVYISEGHERYGNWNYILYYLEAETGGSGSGELTLKDHEGTDLLFETFSPGVTKNEMGTVEGNSGNWTFEIALSGDSYVRMRIAGAIQYTYAV